MIDFSRPQRPTPEEEPYGAVDLLSEQTLFASGYDGEASEVWTAVQAGQYCPAKETIWANKLEHPIPVKVIHQASPPEFVPKLLQAVTSDGQCLISGVSDTKQMQAVSLANITVANPELTFPNEIFSRVARVRDKVSIVVGSGVSVVGMLASSLWSSHIINSWHAGSGEPLPESDTGKHFVVGALGFLVAAVSTRLAAYLSERTHQRELKEQYDKLTSG